MDKALRNALRAGVVQARRRLEGALAEVLQGQYGIHPDGRVEAAAGLDHLGAAEQALRGELLERLRHIQETWLGGGAPTGAAVAQLVREVGFTQLNRLCAYKLLERRKLIREAVGRGLNSSGFKFYLADHPEEEALWSGGEQPLAYQHFLGWLAGTLSREIGALFSPADPAGRISPPWPVMAELLDLLNSPELAPVWDEDETIGWVYQYYTPKELRDQARKESAAPRNAYELAFRNQFYTPRYVVAFLADNTLGRLWWEMRQGRSALAECCTLLVRTPHQPIAVRAPQDPRQMRVLDPACGSGHFLLYCFDLLQIIYEEAWADPELGRELRRQYPDERAFRRALPGLILRHNLHGIDIDLRARQIAALALWLRAQRAYAEAGVASAERPPITTINVVCAEPMPGEVDLLTEFTAGLEARVLGQLARVIFQKMALAGEAGSLLRIEEEISEAVAEAKRQWKAAPKPEQLTLWPTERRPEQLTMFDVAGISDAAFWDEAEGRLLAALRAYSEQTGGDAAELRRLFAEDAAQGFGFVDLCRGRYDVVLMNPPFGESSKPSKSYVEAAYPRGKHDLYTAFVERGLG